MKKLQYQTLAYVALVTASTTVVLPDKYLSKTELPQFRKVQVQDTNQAFVDWQPFVSATKPNVKVGSFTGNGTSQSISGLGFKPDLVMVKSPTDSLDTWFKTVDMAATSSFPVRADAGGDTAHITSLDADGFTVSSDNAVNHSGVSISYLAVKDNGAGVFSTFTYTGDNTDDKLVFSGFQPDFALIKSNSLVVGAMKFSDQASALATPTSNVASMNFGGGSDRTELMGFVSGNMYVSNGANSGGNLVNVNGVAHYGFAFKNLTSYIKAFTYVGDGTSNHAITGVGFQPSFTIIRSPGGASVSTAYASETVGNAQTWDGASVTGITTSLDSDGFHVGSSGDTNANATTYHAFAIRDTSVPTVIYPDKYASQTEVPQFKKPVFQDTNQSFVDWKPLIPTVPLVDKWEPVAPDQTNKTRPTQYLYDPQNFTNLFPSPTVPLPDRWQPVGVDQTYKTRTTTFLYDSQGFTNLFPSAAAPLPDKWEGVSVDQIYKTRITNHLYDGGSYVRFLVPFPDKWLPDLPDQTYKTKATNYLYGVDLLDWQPFIVVPGAPLTSWQPSLSDQTYRTKTTNYLYESSFLTNIFLAGSPFVSIDKWQGVGVDQTYRRRATNYLYSSDLLNYQPFVAPIAPLESWQSFLPDQIYRSKTTNYLYSVDLLNYQPLILPVVPLLSWQPSLPDQTYRPKTTNYIYGSDFLNYQSVIPIAPLESWQSFLPDQVYRTKSTNHLYESAILTNLSSVVSLIDKWQGVSVDQTYRTKNTSHLVEGFSFLGSSSLVLPVTIDKWQPVTSEQLKKTVASLYLYQSQSDIPTINYQLLMLLGVGS